MIIALNFRANKKICKEQKTLTYRLSFFSRNYQNVDTLLKKNTINIPIYNYGFILKVIIIVQTMFKKCFLIIKNKYNIILL